MSVRFEVPDQPGHHQQDDGVEDPHRSKGRRRQDHAGREALPETVPQLPLSLAVPERTKRRWSSMRSRATQRSSLVKRGPDQTALIWNGHCISCEVEREQCIGLRHLKEGTERGRRQPRHGTNGTTTLCTANAEREREKGHIARNCRTGNARSTERENSRSNGNSNRWKWRWNRNRIPGVTTSSQRVETEDEKNLCVIGDLTVKLRNRFDALNWLQDEVTGRGGLLVRGQRARSRQLSTPRQ